MPLPRVRFTVRRMMVAVAIAAIGFGATALYHRRAAFLGKAEDYALRETLTWTTMGHFDHEASLRAADALNEISRTDEEYAAILARDRVRADYYAALKRKYQRAARSPWLPVAPDPPEPE